MYDNSYYVSPIYERLNGDEVELRKFFLGLKGSFESGIVRELPSWSFESIGEFIKAEYSAKELNKSEREEYIERRGYARDPMVRVKDIVKIYIIRDTELMKRFTKEELEGYKFAQKHATLQTECNACIIYESKDGKTISGRTTALGCIRIESALALIENSCIPPQDYKFDTSKPNHVELLALMWWAGVIKFDLDI